MNFAAEDEFTIFYSLNVNKKLYKNRHLLYYLNLTEPIKRINVTDSRKRIARQKI